MDARAWAPILETAPTSSHVALVYREESFLASAVSVWSAPTLRSGGGAILVGTPVHAQSVREELRKDGVDVAALERAGRLVIIDADWLMARFILDGTPDGAIFRELATEIVRGVIAASSGGGESVRAWGEMVSILRVGGNPAAARRLEELWGEVIEEHGIALLCSYSLHARGPDQVLLMSDVAHSHGQVILQPEAEEAAQAHS